MTKEEILNGMSEDEFYRLYPDQESWENAQQMKLGGLSGAPHNGQPTADQFFSYGSHANDGMNIPMSNPFYLATGGTPYYGGPIRPYQTGGTSDYDNKYKEARKQDSTYYDPQYDVMKMFTTGSFDNYDAINTAKKYGYVGGSEDFFKKQKELYDDPDRLGMIDGQEAAYKAYQKGTHKPLALTNNQIMHLGKLYEQYGDSWETDSPMYGKSTYNFKENLSPYDYQRVKSMGEWYKEKHKKYGGYMQDGGDYNSPTNYGSFNVAMQTGGMTAEDWARKEQESIMQRTGQGIPNKVKLTQASQYMYNPFIKGSDIQSYDSTHVSPVDPNLASYFKGSKMIVGPSANTTASKKAAADFNKNKIYEKSGSAYPIYQEYGGILNQDNMMDYPTFETGGKSPLLDIIKAASKKMKKAYGGDTVTQGGNSDNYPQGITSAFKNAIKKNTMNALINEQQEEMSKQFMQTGGGYMDYGQYPQNNMGYNPYMNNYMGYNQYPQMAGYMNYNQEPRANYQNEALQNMYQYKVDQGNQNARYDFNNLLGASDYLTATANPYTKTTVKAKDGLDMSKYSAEELQQLEKMFGKRARGNNYYSGYGQGMPYFPMNYNPYMKMSKQDVGLMQQLAANPSTNLKEFSHRHFGPWGRTKMTFGYKDFYENNMKLKDVPPFLNNKENKTTNYDGVLDDYQHGELFPKVYKPGMSPADFMPSNLQGNPSTSSTTPVDNRIMDWENKKGFPTGPETNMLYQGKRYGGLTKAQYGRDHKSTNPADGEYDDNGNIKSPINMTPISANPTFSNYVNDQGLKLNQQQAHLKDPATNSMFTGPEKQATVTSKFRPGFNGEAMANWGIAGINALSSGLEQIQNSAKNKKKLNELQLADNSFVATPANAQSEGDYDQWGNFRPNKKFTGRMYGAAYGGFLQEGGMQSQAQPDPQQLMQGVAQMLQQGAQPQEVAKQLVEIGIPQDKVVLIIKTVMQQLQGGQEQPAMRYGGYAKGGQYEEGEEVDLSPEEIEDLRSQGYDVEYLD
jgi:hypothetical protein